MKRCKSLFGHSELRPFNEVYSSAEQSAYAEARYFSAKLGGSGQIQRLALDDLCAATNMMRNDNNACHKLWMRSPEDTATAARRLLCKHKYFVSYFRSNF